MNDLEDHGYHVLLWKIERAKKRLGKKWILHPEHGGKKVEKLDNRTAIDMELERVEAERLKHLTVKSGLSTVGRVRSRK